MADHRPDHKNCGFKPVNTLHSAQEPTFVLSDISENMVNEREPPRGAEPQKPIQSLTKDPAFGAPSPIRNPLGKERSSVFYKPKPYQAHREHHRSANPPPSSSSSQGFRPSNPPYRQPALDRGPSHSPDVVEIPRPSNIQHRPILAAPQPLFSSGATFVPVNGWRNTASNTIDLTKTTDDRGFNPDRALGIDRYGSFDPSNFMDSAKASENIKALLEGAFEDDEDKPTTRLRKKKRTQAAEALTDKMNGLKVSEKTETDKGGADIEEDEEDDGTVEGLSVKLLPHQIDGVAWMLDKEVETRKKNGVLPKGGILADDMGLGKTIQALALILTNRRPSADAVAKNPKLKIPEAAEKGTLIVAPLALIKQWESEIKTKVDVSPKLKVLVHHGPSRTKRYEDLKKYDIVITTYQTLTSEHGDSSPDDKGLKVGCFGVHWYRVVLDEAHSIKNRNAKMTKASYDLQSVYRWCLTGTPMQNNLDELQSLIRFLRIKPYSDLASWREQIGKPMKNGRGGLAMKRLQYFLKAFMKRRTKEILKKEGALNFGSHNSANGGAKSDGFKIVARNVQVVVADFSDAEREFYRKLEARTEKNLAAMMDGYKNDYIGALVLLLRLRQTCNHPELIKGSLRKEKESISSGSQLPSALSSPRKAHATKVDDLDDVANLFGAMTVETKKCDSCGSKLNREEMGAGSIRCDECEDDFKKLGDFHRNREGPKSKEKIRGKSAKTRRKGPVNHSDDDNDDDNVDSDDGEGDWVVPDQERKLKALGKAGGKVDEDAEGGGRWLGDDDSEDESERTTTTMDSFIEHDTEGGDGSETDEESNNDVSDNSISVDRRHVPSAKIRKLIQLLEKESGEHKFIVFSEFTSMLDILEPFLRNAGLHFTRYDGSMKNDDREASLERLRNDSRVRILLCSLRCGSLGLNLTAASRVVIMEPFWNPFVEEQAIDRVHRLNQTRDVNVYRLTIANTVEERIIALQERKRELAAAALDGGKAVGKLSMQDILDLFKRDAEHDAGHEDAKTLALGSGKSAGVLKPSSDADSRNGTSGHAPMARPITTSTPARLGASQRAGNTPKFTIPKSLQADYQAYKQRDPFLERR